ncbi:hypothetical protein CASFOL_014783 [Castilleja foliolosa]|uniref:Proteasome subunit alpha type 5 n=1 Tax=Castilleja foliolosa TaxID=1961234 RepID=A0ABD3DBW5_9LAMI
MFLTRADCFEYAIEAIKLGSTAIGIKTKEGVVLAVEKRITSPLLEPSSVDKIMEIDAHIGCAMSGLIADARTLVEHARVETQNHRFSYGEPMTVESTTQALCDLALRFGEGDEESMSRPFGVSLLIAGHDENGPSLYYTDPSGTFWQCNAKAIGSGSEGADSSLQEQFNKDSKNMRKILTLKRSFLNRSPFSIRVKSYPSLPFYSSAHNNKLTANGDNNNGTNCSSLSSYNDQYKALNNLDFMTAAKILFSDSPMKKKKFGLDFHLVQLLLVCLPSLAVYLVAQYARSEMRKMDAV